MRLRMSYSNQARSSQILEQQYHTTVLEFYLIASEKTTCARLPPPKIKPARSRAELPSYDTEPSCRNEEIKEHVPE